MSIASPLYGASLDRSRKTWQVFYFLEEKKKEKRTTSLVSNESGSFNLLTSPKGRRPMQNDKPNSLLADW